ncbi:NHL repeat-containing protein [Candidatus Lokiarchaeum ossiferum]|uniref:NHL repeat-containing protein n=1 Tax=Candidatus Lokiarchaeum ossiferum TaxID=2951803 RepID=UPI00352CD9B6
MAIKTNKNLKSSNFLILGFFLTLLFLQAVQVSTLLPAENNDQETDIVLPLAAAEFTKPVYETYWGRSDFEYGAGEKEFDEPGQICADGSGNIYVLDINNERIQKFNPAGDYIDEFPVYNANYLDIDVSNGLLYITNLTTIQILQTNGTLSENWALPIGSGDGQLTSPGGLGLNDTHIFIGDYVDGDVKVFDKATHTFAAKFDRNSESIGEISDIVINKTGYIYVATSTEHNVQLYDPNYNFVDNMTVGLSYVDAIQIDHLGNIFTSIYVWDQSFNYVDSYADFGTEAGQLGGVSGFTMANGYLYISERYNNRISLFKYGPEPPKTGIIWEDFKLLTPDGTYNPWHMDMAKDSEGNIHIAWQDGDNGFGTASAWDIYYRWLNIETGEWSGIKLVSDDSIAGSSWQPSIALDSTGKVHIAWTATLVTELHQDIYYRTFEPSNGTWSTIISITPVMSSKVGAVKMDVDTNGNPHFVWDDNGVFDSASDDFRDFYYRNYTVATKTLSGVILLSKGASNVFARDTDMDVDSNNIVHCVWTNNFIEGLHYRNFNPSTGVLSTMENWSINAWQTQIEVDSHSNVHLSWASSSNLDAADTNGGLDIYYQFYNASSSTWTDPDWVSKEAGISSEGNNLALDKNDNVHIIWSNGTRIFYRKYNVTDGDWGQTDSPIDYIGTGAYIPKVEIDNYGEVHIVWADNTDNLLGSGSDRDIFYRTSAYLPTNLAYRSVLSNLNFTAEIWKFFGANKSITADGKTYIESNVSSYSMRSNVWAPHRKLGEGYKNITMYKDSTKEDIAIQKMAWGSRDELNLPNLKWRYNVNGDEIADIYGATINTAIFDTETTGENWVRFTSSNALYSKYFIYLRVNEAGILEEFHHQERREKLHLILEDDYVKFLNDQGIDYSTDQEPIYMRTSNEPKDSVPSSASRVYISTSMGDLPIFPWGAQESTPLYRYTPTTTVTSVDTYSGSGLEDVEGETFAISKPEVEVVTTHQIAEVEYYDESSGSWQPSDNGNGDNTYIIGSANKETSLPLIMGDDLKMPMVLPEDPLFPSNEYVQDLLGSSTSVNITGNSIYIEITVDGTDYFLDVAYGEDGTATKYEARLPSEGGIQEVEMASITETEALAYIEEINSGTTNGTSTDDIPGDDDTINIPGYAPISLIWIGLVSITMLIHKSKKRN